MKSLLSAFLCIFLCSGISIEAQYLVSGQNLFSSAKFIIPGDDSSSYVVGEFISYEINNPSPPNIISYNFKMGDSIVVADSCGYEHFSNKTFISKISKQGIVQWIRISESCDTLSQVQVKEVAADDMNNLLVLGTYNREVEIAGARLSSIAEWDMFLYKISPTGDLIWQKNDFARGDTSSVLPEDLHTVSNNIFISGSYTGAASFSGDLFQCDNSQFFLLEMDTNGDQIETLAGLPVTATSSSSLYDIDTDQNTDINGILSVKDSVLLARKLLSSSRDTLGTLTGFEQLTLYVVDTFDVGTLTAVVDSFYTNPLPDSTHWFYLAEYSAITIPAVILDTIYRDIPTAPLNRNFIAISRGDSLAFSTELPAVPQDFLIDKNDNGMYGIYNYSSDLLFGTDLVTANVFPSALLVKYKFDGGLDWYKSGYSATDTVEATSFSIDPASNIFLAGSVGSETGNHILNFDGQDFPASYNEDAFVMKLELGVLAWGQIIGDSASDKINDIYAFDRFNIIAAGEYSKQLEWDRFSIETSGIRDLFAGYINPYPSFDLSIVSHQDLDLPLCDGDSILLTAHSAHSSDWQWFKDSLIISGKTADSLWITESGEYFVKAYSQSIFRDDLSPFSKSSGMLEFEYNPYPNDTIVLEGTTAFCFGEEASLQIITAAEDTTTWYRLSDGLVAINNQINITETGNYYARVEASTGCVSMSDTIAITVIDLPDDSIAIIGDNYLYCAGDSLQIKSFDPGSNQYTWYRDGDSILTTNTSIITFKTPGAYSAEITNTQNCSILSDTLDLVEIAPPVLQQWFDAESSGICAGEQAEIRMSNHGSTIYTWFFNNDTIVGDTLSVLLAEEEGYYRSTLLKEGVCEVFSDTFFLEVHPIPVVDLSISPDSVICENEEATLSLSTTGSVDYQWFLNGALIPEAQSSSISVSESGVYYGSVSNEFLCSVDSRNIPLVVKRVPNLTLGSESNKLAFCTNDSLLLEAQNATGVLYQWQHNGQPIAANGVQHYTNIAGTFSVYVSDTLSGCSSMTNALEIVKWSLPDNSIEFINQSPLCDRDTLLLVSGTDEGIYDWYRNGELLILDKNKTIKVFRDGNYQLRVQDVNNCTSVSSTIALDFLSSPIPTIQQDINFLSTSLFDNILWYEGNSSIEGAVGQVFDVTESGFYHVEVTHANGCVAASHSIQVCAPFPEISVNRNVLLASPGNSYQWFFGQDTIFGANEDVYIAQVSGSYSVDIMLSDGCVSRSPEVSVCYPIPEIELGDNNVLKSSLGLTYQWYKDNKVIPGADARLYVVGSTGEYKVEVEDLGQCISFSDPIYMDLTGRNSQYVSALQVYPNPFSEGISIGLPDQDLSSGMTIKIHNALGTLVYEKPMEGNPEYLELDGMTPGIYLLSIEGKSVRMQEIILKK